MIHADHAEMLRVIAQETALTGHLTGRASLAPRVMAAMAAVPREQFVPPELRHQAFANHPLPIGAGQTISQPFIVALMTDLLDPQPGHRVLDIGTGCGYQAAVLAELVAEVDSIELIPELAVSALERLERLGYRNVAVHTGDGYRGWPEQAPYDGIVVTAAAPHVPPALVAQLAPGGRLVIPVGPPYSHQELLVIKKDTDGRVDRRTVLGVVFVPLVEGP